jgi:hypothetical protein
MSHKEFTDRIMVAVARESAPTPARTFVSALRAHSVGDAVSAIWVAWHLGTVRRWQIAPGVRARSMALVLAVVCALGTGSLATAAALRVAAEPVMGFFQSGVDEQGPVENGSSGVDQHQDGDIDNGGVTPTASHSGVSEPVPTHDVGLDQNGHDEDRNDQSGPDRPDGQANGNDQIEIDESPSGEETDDGQQDTEAPGGGSGESDDHSGTDKPVTRDSGDGDHSGGDQPGGDHNGGDDESNP